MKIKHILDIRERIPETPEEEKIVEINGRFEASSQVGPNSHTAVVISKERLFFIKRVALWLAENIPLGPEGDSERKDRSPRNSKGFLIGETSIELALHRRQVAK